MTLFLDFLSMASQSPGWNKTPIYILMSTFRHSFYCLPQESRQSKEIIILWKYP
jgi:hypothetical protein